jgi:hypothetical protein
LHFETLPPNLWIVAVISIHAGVVPPVVDHVTAVFIMPLTPAANCSVSPVVRETEDGEIEMVSVWPAAC